MPEVVIIGAGLTGLSAAYHLEKRGFSDYELYEKESTTGGLCRSIYQDGFTFDFTGHLLHTSDEYFKNLIESLVGLDHLESIERRSFIYSHDVYTRYPFQVNLYGLPEDVIAECIEGYVTRKKNRKRRALNFKEWVLEHFGEGFAKHFFFPFQGKILAHDLEKVTSTWMGRFVPQTSLAQLLKGALKDNIERHIGYNSQFYYPKKGGIYAWVNRLAQHVKKSIYTDYAVSSIDLEHNIITFSNGHSTTFKKLISTMPLDRLLGCIKEKSDTHLKRSRSKLRCNSVINFNLGIKRDDVSDKHWIYFPEEKYPFYRLGFPHNFSEHMAPAGCSSLYGELSYIKKSPEMLRPVIQEAIAQTKQLLSIDDQDIATEKIINIPHAYVIYDKWRERHLPDIHKALGRYNIHSVGRYGEWKYSSMQEAVLDGKAIAETIAPQHAEFPLTTPRPEHPEVQS